MDESSTEEKIKEAARKVFMKKGKTGSRMQEIADQAGINKALLHYYYRSKDQLFNAIFEELLAGFMPQLFAVLNSDVPLEVKVYQATEKYITFLSVHKELPLFILGEIQQNPARLAERMQVKKSRFSVLDLQLKEEISAGKLRPVSLEMFIMNMISLLVFPFVSRELFQHIMDLEEDQFDHFMEERKKAVPKFFMDALRT